MVDFHFGSPNSIIIGRNNIFINFKKEFKLNNFISIFYSFI